MNLERKMPHTKNLVLEILWHADSIGSFIQQWATTSYSRDKIDLTHYVQDQAFIFAKKIMLELPKNYAFRTRQTFPGWLEMVWKILNLYFIHNTQINKKNWQSETTFDLLFYMG